MPRNRFAAALKHGGRLFAGLVAAAVLMPLPAMALTFTGTWAATYAQSGGPTPPTPTFSDVTNNAQQEDNLSLNMGNYQGLSAPATSTINLTRGISIGEEGQSVDFAHELYAGFKNAGADVSVSVKNSSGHTVVAPIHLNLNNTSNNLQYFRSLQNSVADLNQGHYTLNVQVRYFTNNKMGAWKSISASHQFEFEGESEGQHGQQDQQGQHGQHGQQDQQGQHGQQDQQGQHGQQGQQDQGQQGQQGQQDQGQQGQQGQ